MERGGWPVTELQKVPLFNMAGVAGVVLQWIANGIMKILYCTALKRCDYKIQKKQKSPANWFVAETRWVSYFGSTPFLIELCF